MLLVVPALTCELCVHRQVQELESKFKDAYSQSLSNKDERIQVLEKRVEETIRDNAQLREDLVNLRKQNEKLKESRGGSHGSPADMGRLRVMQDKVRMDGGRLGRSEAG